uniref:NADH-ubiquinone oxidoreductase chain 2 n=1 Tax=Trioza erytreae TaxID=1778831 RepID=A0A6M8YG71_TRIEB|nr:NADH dehydrogenase subunit 2 [Trioza erytreae]
MYNFNIMVFPMYLLSIIFSLSSSSWILIWMGMEMNLISFIFIMLNHPIYMMKMESSMKYFLIQSLGSLIFLLTINNSMIYYNEKFLIFAMVPPMALMLKSGMAPLHSWTPMIVNKFSMKNVFLFFTLQKLVPFFILFSSWNYMISYISNINIIIGTIGGMTQSSLIKMMIFSSINNTGWMMMSMMNSFSLFLLYFMNYFVLSFFMMKFIFKLQIKWIIQINILSMKIKWFYFMTVMSLSGFPPFMSFTPKWLIMKNLYTHYTLNILLGIIFSTISLFFYIKSSLIMLTSYSSVKKINSIKLLSTNIFMLINLTGPFMFYIFN